MKYLPAILSVAFFFTAERSSMAQKTLAIVGSSTSACFGSSVVDSCYVGRLRNYFNVQAPNDTIIDNGYAVGGYNCYQGMPSTYKPPYTDDRFQPDPNHNISKAIAAHPNVILVNYPTNDYDILPIDSILYCLRTIRDSANKAGIPCFVTTTQPRTSGSFSSSVVKHKLAELKDSILLAFGYFAIDFYTGLFNPADSSIRYDAGDGIHMNDTGHDSLFHRVVAKNIFFAALPANFLQFTTLNKNNTNIINWTTSQETDVDFYEIQRSSDRVNFSTIASMNANNITGNNEYQFTDNQPLKGWSYYKILIIDRDGKKHASPVMSVRVNTGKLNIVQTFANAASQVVVTVENNEPQTATLQIFNNMGMIIFKTSRKIETGTTTLYLDTPLLSNGVYHIKLISTGESVTSSFIKN